MANRVCPTCGEEYSDTYKECPFCEEAAAIEKGKPLRRGGKHSEKRRRGDGGAGGVMLLLTAVIILGVVVYVFFGEEIAAFMGIRTQSPGEIQGGETLPPEDGNPAGPGGDVTPPGEDDGSGQPVNPGPAPGPLTLESPGEFTIAAGETGRLTVSGGTGDVVWTSSNSEIATVEDGAVTGVAGGSVTITATAGEESVSCKVNVTGEPWVSGAALKLNKTDFSFSQQYPDPVQLKVEGEYASVSWSIDNTGVATVSADGLVTRVGKGVATVTAVVDGQVLTCTVRSNF